MNTETEIPADEATDAELDAEAMQDAMADAARDAEAEALEAAEEAAADPADAPEGDGPDLAAEVQDLKDKLLRAMAESENTRRIAAREKADATKYAVTNFARDILRVADFLNMATMAVTDEARKADQSLDNLCVGIDMTMKELLNVFEGQGIKPIKTEGLFDHNLHEAVSQEENVDVPKGTILRVQRGGFTIQDRLLRPAQVVVSTGGAAEKGAAEDTAEEAPAEGGQQAYESEGSEPGQNLDQET